MQINPKNPNDLWADHLIDALIKGGVETFCMSPGARSTPLLLAAKRHPIAQLILHYDERGMAYHALGLSKGSRKPVALIVTSGTAVGNLLPAIMEAFHQNIPLVILSADRPQELHDCVANQTTDQTKIFSQFVLFEHDLPCPDHLIPLNYVSQVVAEALCSALHTPRGPVHLNCRFRKPLTEKGFQNRVPNGRERRSSLSFGRMVLEGEEVKKIADELQHYQKGLILVGEKAEIKEDQALLALSKRLGWPILPDFLSPIRRLENEDGVIDAYDLILKAQKSAMELRPEAILQLGSRFVSSELPEWISTLNLKWHLQLSPNPRGGDPTFTINERAVGEIDPFLREVIASLPEATSSDWIEKWVKLNAKIKADIHHFFKEATSLSEPLIFHQLKDLIPSKYALFFANSMIIRNGENFFFPRAFQGPIYANRGLSGIDGNIATACGIAKGCKKPFIAFIGDLAFLHDLNSLPFMKELSIKLIVINNGGGDIFHFLETGGDAPLFTTPHRISFMEGAALVGICYQRAESVRELIPLLGTPEPMIIEIGTKEGGNKLIHDQLIPLLKRP